MSDVCPNRRRCDYVDPHHEGPCAPTPAVELAELKAELAAAVPVVEAARAVTNYYRHADVPPMPESFARHLDELAARVRAHTEGSKADGT